MWNILADALESHEFSSILEKIHSNTMTAAMEKCDQLFHLYEEFGDWIKEGNLGPLAIFWQSFSDMVQTLLDYIKSMRTGNWDLHLKQWNEC